MSQKEDGIIMKEIEKIIDSNKLKASNLRNTLLNLNQNIYTKDLHFQVIQFLGEFEYDLKTLLELFIDFKSKIELDFQNNMNSIFSEINSLKKENLILKGNNKNKNKEDNNNLFYNAYKPRISKSNKNLSTTLNKMNNINKNNNTEKAINKPTSLYLHLKNQNIKKKLNEIIKNKNKSSNNNLNRTNINSEHRAYIRHNSSNQKNEENVERENLPLYPYQRKQNANTEMNFYLNKSNTSNNINRRKFFYDYDTYLTNLKRGSLYNSNINLIKYDNYMQDKNNTVNHNKPDLKKIARGKISIDKEKKRKIIFEIFRDEKLLSEIKKQFGNDIENKLLNEDIDFNFFKKVEEIANKIRKKIYYTPKIKSASIDMNEMKENISYNFKIPKRFSN